MFVENPILRSSEAWNKFRKEQVAVGTEILAMTLNGLNALHTVFIEVCYPLPVFHGVE